MGKAELTVVGRAPQVLSGLNDEQLLSVTQGRKGEALTELVMHLLEDGIIDVGDEFIQVPKDKAEHLHMGERTPLIRSFFPENVPFWYVPEQINGFLTIHDVWQKIRCEELLGATHLEAMIDNWWRIPVCLDHVSLIFLGTIFCDITQRLERLAPNQLYVYSMYKDGFGRKVELLPMTTTLSRHHVIAVPQMPAGLVT